MTTFETVNRQYAYPTAIVFISSRAFLVAAAGMHSLTILLTISGDRNQPNTIIMFSISPH